MPDRVATSAEARVQVVREAIDAFNRRDFDGMVQIDIADDFVYDWSRGLGPNSGIYRGTEGFREFISDQWSTFEEIGIEVHEMFPRGRHVIVGCTTHARGRQGIPVRANSTLLYTFEGDSLSRITLYQDRSEALTAAGE